MSGPVATTNTGQHFDSLVEPTFKRDAAGRVVYFPFGPMARGRILPDDAFADRMRTRLRHYYMAMLLGAPLLIIGGVVALIWWLNTLTDVSADRNFQALDGVFNLLNSPGGILSLIVVSLALGVLVGAWVSWPAFSLPKSDLKLTFRELRIKQSSSLGAHWKIGIMAVAAMQLFALTHRWMHDPDPRVWFLGFQIVFWSAIGVYFAAQLFTRERQPERT
ncbi:MAG: hypothetical protein ACK5JT_21590 [Hyphomicrobiaceae bacterium]